MPKMPETNRKSQGEVHEDIKINDMSRSYTRWIDHGEGDNDVEQARDGEVTVVPVDMSWEGND